MQPSPRAEYADDAHHHPEDIECGIGSVIFEKGAPGQYRRVYGVEYPDEHERTRRPHPAYQGEAEDAHEHTRHFDVFDVLEDNAVSLSEQHDIGWLSG
jgi:hypothetical protein